ncbi:MAG: LysR family transcriptional regulator [Solirubrobacterales bacterium]|nr:LysR family transcriptional regulator [Solirubrobacterales bacterium]
MSEHVELREIRVFLMLCEELHFGRTAERLRISQTRVSQTIQKLEAKIGAPLFERTSRRVALTNDGARLREEVAPVHEEMTEVLRRAQAASRTPPLRLGLFCDQASLIPHIARRFEATHDGQTVEAAEVPVADPFAPLRDGEIDLMASWLPHGQSGLDLGPILSSEPRVLAVSVDHPLALRSEVSLEDVADYRVVRVESPPRELHETWIPSMSPAGRAIRHQHFSDRSLGDRGRMTTELVHLIATGRIVHPTIPSFANVFGHPDIVYIPITDLPPLRGGLLWRRGSTDQRVYEFARVAEEVVGAQSGDAVVAAG